jgi:hypothetical protein
MHSTFLSARAKRLLGYAARLTRCRIEASMKHEVSLQQPVIPGRRGDTGGCPARAGACFFESRSPGVNRFARLANGN